MMPNDKDTLEEIQKALDAATDEPLYADPDIWPGNDNLSHWVNTHWDGIGAYVKYEDAYLAANAPEWLRYLLEQNKQLQAETDLWKAEYNRAKSDVLKLEVNLGEERDRWKEEALLQARLYTEKNEQLERLRGELEQLKAERDKYQTALHAEQKENVRLMEELAAKDKVLEWYGKPQHYNNWPSPLFATDQGQRARAILQRYERGDNTDGDDGKAPSDLG